MMRALRFLVGFIIGLAIGGGIVMLLAPGSGVETRTRLRSRVDRLLDEGRQAAEQTRADAHARMAALKAK
jgi:gas vesicle protein